MRRGIPSWRVLPLALLAAAVPASPASAVWRDVVTRDSPRSAVATCLRATGVPGQVGLLGPLERRTAPYDLLRVTPESTGRADTVRLGVLRDCPAVASDPSGYAVVAGMVGARRGLRVVASVAAPGGGFGPVVDLGPGGTFGGVPVAAVSPRGDAVVAWVEQRLPSRRDASGASRVTAVLRPAGGSFGPPRHLTGWRRSPFDLGAELVAGMDAAGGATLAWALGAPGRGRAAANSTVAVAGAPPGGPFVRAQTLTRRAYDIEAVALAVAPSGAAVLAHDGGAIWRFTRRAGARRFERLEPIGARDRDPTSPTVAVAADGSAIVAWRIDDPRFLINAGVAMSERTGTGPFSRPRTVWAGEQPRDFGSFESIYLKASRGRVFAPIDDRTTELRATLAADGRYLLAWGVKRRSALHDGPLGVRVANGSLAMAETTVRTLGCRCRSVNGLAPLILADGEPGVAFTDNVSGPSGLSVEWARGGGRLHVAADRPPTRAPAPPSVRVARPSSRTLKYEEGIPISVRCGGPCDLRAYVVDRGRARGFGTATLGRAGRTRVPLEPDAGSHLAPKHAGRVRVLVRAWTPGGRRYSQASVPVVLRRAPVRPLARLLEVRAVRQGSSILVSWKTDRPSPRDLFIVAGRRARTGQTLGFAFRQHPTKTSFRVRLRPERGVPAASIHWVNITLIRGRPPNDERAVTVPVTG